MCYMLAHVLILNDAVCKCAGVPDFVCRSATNVAGANQTACVPVDAQVAASFEPAGVSEISPECLQALDAADYVELNTCTEVRLHELHVLCCETD